MSDKGWVGRALATGFLRWVGFSAAPWLLALGVAALTLIAGVLRDGMPWMWILMASSLAFGGTAVGMLRVSEMRDRWRVEDKLTFDKVRIGKKLNNLGCVEWIKLGFQVHNSALFPIEAELKSLYTSLDEKFPPKKERLLKKAITQAGRSSFFDDDAIVPFEPPRDRSVEGKIEFVVRYGRLGHPKHNLTKKLQIFVAFDSKGDAKVVSHNDIM